METPVGSQALYRRLSPAPGSLSTTFQLVIAGLYLLLRFCKPSTLCNRSSIVCAVLCPLLRLAALMSGDYLIISLRYSQSFTVFWFVINSILLKECWSYVAKCYKFRRMHSIYYLNCSKAYPLRKIWCLCCRPYNCMNMLLFLRFPCLFRARQMYADLLI